MYILEGFPARNPLVELAGKRKRGWTCGFLASASGNVFPNTARFHARLGLMFSFKLSAQPLQMNFGATAHAAQLSLRGLNSENIEQTLLGSKNEELFQRSWQSSGRNSVLITTYDHFSAQWLAREALQLLVCDLLQLVVCWSTASEISPSASQSGYRKLLKMKASVPPNIWKMWATEQRFTVRAMRLLGERSSWRNWMRQCGWAIRGFSWTCFNSVWSCSVLLNKFMRLLDCFSSAFWLDVTGLQLN